MTEVAERTAIQDILREHATASGDNTAVIVDEHVRTYCELDAISDQLAAALLTHQVTAGDRVVHVAVETVHYFELLYAVAKIGAVLVPINHRLAADEVNHIVSDCGAKLAFVDRDSAGVVTTAEVQLVRVDDGQWDDFIRVGSQESLPPLAPDPHRPLAQLYTSGTTGLPKGVVLSHQFAWAVMDNVIAANMDWITVEPGDACLLGIPGFHVGGLWYSLQAFNAGATVVGLSRFDPQHVRDLCATLPVTTAIVVPAMLQSLMAVPGTEPHHFAAMRKIIYGGAPAAEDVLHRSLQLFGAEFAQIYGLTETGNTAICLPPSAHDPAAGLLRAAGRPYPGVQVRITDEDGGELPIGEVGEVWLHTPAAMLEYWGQPEATAQTLVDGWIRTGDVGYLDSDGWLFLHDRINDMILVGGENVYPAELENALMDHRDVDDAAVVGVPDESTGEAPFAYVQLRPGATLNTRDLLLHLRSRVADFKLPRRIMQIDQVPRNASGKILRRTLRESHWADRDRKVN